MTKQYKYILANFYKLKSITLIIKNIRNYIASFWHEMFNLSVTLHFEATFLHFVNIFAKFSFIKLFFLLLLGTKVFIICHQKMRRRSVFSKYQVVLKNGFWLPIKY